jgi:hypothetical protein
MPSKRDSTDPAAPHGYHWINGQHVPADPPARVDPPSKGRASTPRRKSIKPKGGVASRPAPKEPLTRSGGAA